jgi:hypothetical protein
MRQRLLVQQGAPVLSVRQMFDYQRENSLVVGALMRVNEFVDNQVFQALHRLFGEFQVQPNATSVCIAGAPLGLHALDTPVRQVDINYCLTFEHKGQSTLS